MNNFRRLSKAPVFAISQTTTDAHKTFRETFSAGSLVMQEDGAVEAQVNWFFKITSQPPYLCGSIYVEMYR